MTIKTASANIGFYFTAFNYRWQVVKADSFGGVVHYGFIPLELEHYPKCGAVSSGWIPAALIGGCELTK